MPTHAELAGKLLSDAATFFKTLAEENADIRQEMTENAGIFEQMGHLITTEPEGAVQDKSHAELAGQLLKDAATFFRSLAEDNEPLREIMTENAAMYDQIATQVQSNPLGILE